MKRLLLQLSSPGVAPHRLTLCVLLASVVVIAFALGPVMRESDQASILFGAVQLADGTESPLRNAHYNYDKQYVTYLLMALARRVAPDVDVVLLGNIMGFSIFWGGLATLLVTGRVRQMPQAAALTTVLLSPALWLFTPYLSSAGFSGGLYFLAWVAWRRTGRSPALPVIALLLTFLAVGARADAVLALPWLAWCLTPAQIMSKLWHRQRIWQIAVAGLAAVLVGRMIFSGHGVDFHAPFFLPKVYGAFLFFGLGAAALSWLWFVARLGCCAGLRFNQHRPTGWFYLAGVLALLLPAIYYLPQMFSPRYWLVLLCTLLPGLLTRRGACLLGFANRPRATAALTLVWLAGALIPLGIGLRLPFPNRPHLTFGPATLYPSADGLQPMGALLAYHFSTLAAPNHLTDHNQATWLSARAVHYEANASGQIPVLDFSLRSYVQLAAALRGQPSVVVPATAPFFYSDMRDLLRTYHTPDRFLPASRLNESSTLNIQPVGPEIAGRQIVRVQSGLVPNRAWLTQQTLARAFGGNDFLPRDFLKTGAQLNTTVSDEGKTLVLYGSQPFSVQLTEPDSEPHQLSAERYAADLFLLRLDGRTWSSTELRITQGQAAVAITVHPDYMGTDRLR